MTRSEQKAATRAALVEAARRCFSARDFGGTTIADVAREAGVASGTVYVHFAGKEALLDALLDEFNRSLAKRLAPVLAASGEGELRGTIRATARAFLDHWEQERALVAAYVERQAASVPALRDGVNPPMFELLGAAVAARMGASTRTELVTHALLAMWLRVGMQYLFNEAVSRRTAIDVLTSMTLGAVAGVERR